MISLPAKALTKVLHSRNAADSMLWFAQLNCAPELLSLFKYDPTFSTAAGLLKAVRVYEQLCASFDPSDDSVCVFVLDPSTYGGLTAFLAHLSSWKILCLPLKTNTHKFFSPPGVEAVPVDGVEYITREMFTIATVPKQCAIVGSFHAKWAANKVFTGSTGCACLITDLPMEVPNTPLYLGSTLYHLETGDTLQQVFLNLEDRGMFWGDLGLRMDPEDDWYTN